VENPPKLGGKSTTKRERIEKKRKEIQNKEKTSLAYGKLRS
jgi:hypothetical protein